MRGVCIFLGGLLVGYVLICTLCMGAVSFNAFLGAAGAALCLFGYFLPRLQVFSWFLPAKRFLITGGCFAFLLFCVGEAAVVSGVLHRDEKPADYLIILGAGLREDRLSLTLKQRLDAALEAYQGEYIVVTGGQGPNEALAEGDAMAAYLMEQGVDASRILVENRSTNTHENLEFAREIIQTHSKKPVEDCKVKIITSDYHCARAILLAKRTEFSLATAYGAKTHPLLVPSFYIREGLAMVKSYLFDR